MSCVSLSCQYLPLCENQLSLSEHIPNIGAHDQREQGTWLKGSVSGPTSQVLQS